MGQQMGRHEKGQNMTVNYFHLFNIFLSLPPPLPLSLLFGFKEHTLFYTRTTNLSLILLLTSTHTLSLSLSHTHTHTHRAASRPSLTSTICLKNDSRGQKRQAARADFLLKGFWWTTPAGEL